MTEIVSVVGFDPLILILFLERGIMFLKRCVFFMYMVKNRIQRRDGLELYF